MVHRYTAEASLSLSRGPGREPGASLHTRKRLSLTGGRAKRESLVPPYIRGSVSLTGGGAKRESLVPPYSRGSVSLSHGGRGERRKPGASLYTSLSLNTPYRVCV